MTSSSPLAPGGYFPDITTWKLGRLHVLDDTVCWWRTFLRYLSRGRQDGIWRARRKEEGRRKEIGWGVEVQGSHRLLLVTRNLPRLMCMTRAFKNVWQIPQMRDTTPKCRAGKRHRMNVEFVALVHNMSCSLGLKISLFLMYFSLQNYKVRVPTRGEGR